MAEQPAAELTAEAIKECPWLKPKLAAQVEFTRMDIEQSPASPQICGIAG